MTIYFDARHAWTTAACLVLSSHFWRDLSRGRLTVRVWQRPLHAVTSLTMVYFKLVWFLFLTGSHLSPVIHCSNPEETTRVIDASDSVTQDSRGATTDMSEFENVNLNNI